MVWLVFFLLGDGTCDRLTAQVFILIYVPFCSISQPFGVLANSKVDFINEKWALGENEEHTSKPDLKNPWRLIAPFTLSSGFVAALILIALLELFSISSLRPSAL